MKKFLRIALVLGLLAAPPAAGAVAKEIVQLQRDVALLQQQLRELQKSVDERTAVLKTLVEQALDSTNRMNVAVVALERSVHEVTANTGTKVDALTTQAQGIRDAVDELGARLGRLSQQLAETRGVLESLDARVLALSAPKPLTEPGGPPPSADTLYYAALNDFNSGKFELARQQFADYLKHYGNTELAGNARFYIGETYFQQRDFARAVQEYDGVISDHPNSYKIAAAHLKRGYALLEQNEREAGARALRAVTSKFPKSEEAQMARQRLQRLQRPSGSR